MPRFKIEYAAVTRAQVEIEASSQEEAVKQFNDKNPLAHIFAATNQQASKTIVEVESVTNETIGVKTLPDGKIIVRY